MLDRLERSQLCEYGLAIVIGHIAEADPRHDGAQIASSHLAGAHSVNEGILVTRNARGIGRDVGTVRHPVPMAGL
jgi:hypothetical protein